MCRDEDFPPYPHPSRTTVSDDEFMVTGLKPLDESSLVARLHDALSTDPRGCEHPRAMKPQCERIAARIQTHARPSLDDLAGLDSIGLPMGPILLPSSFIDDRYEWARLQTYAKNAWEKVFWDLTREEQP